MAKQTANKGNKGNTKAIDMARADETGDEGGETEGGGVSGWAREVARLSSGSSNNAARRFLSLALYLQSVAQPGKTVTVSFAAANAGAGLRRGETGNPAASWRLALQRTRQIFAGQLPEGIEARVLADEGKIEVTQPAK